MFSKSLTVITGNRLETLAGDLAGRLRRGRGVFDRETVVVPSKGTARWLVSWLARNNEICANIEFSLPKSFIAGRLCGLKEEDAQACAPENVRWRIYEALPKLIAERPDEFSSPASYIADGDHGSKLKRWQLAGKLADCFDQYITLRPDMILDWERRPDASAPPPQLGGKRSPQWIQHWRWQRALWLEVMAGLDTHLPREFARILEGGLNDGALPKRVFAFGFSTMPPVYLDIFTALGRQVDSVLHYLNPCQGYWAEIKSEKESLRELSKFNPDDWCEMHMDEPNELLASFGKAGREFFAKLVASSDNFNLEELFTEPSDGPEKNLHLLQRGVYTMAPARELAEEVRKFPADVSVKIHSCHSRMREVEVLRDEILDLLDRNSSASGENPMRPSDIIVMAPDISKYAPFIRAVFGGDRRGGLKIDFSIADQSLGAETPEASAFMSILKIPQGRFTAEEVLSPLDCQTVREKLSLDSEDLEWLRAKLREAGAAWGVDAENRREIMLRDGSTNPPSFEENSWRFALDRIILGHAMERAKDLSGTLQANSSYRAPLGLGEGDGARVAGAFASYFDKLENFAKKISSENSVSSWQAILMELVDDFFMADGQNPDGVIATVKTIGELLRTAQRTLPIDSTLPYDVVLSAANEAISSESTGGGFLRGGVTFCRMQPLRNIPARVVCLLGMNDKEFPRTDKERGFDLLREGRRLCDRSPRDDDRQLFLDAILSARDALRIFYVGQNDKDNSVIPPSPAVEEFCEHLKAVFGDSCLRRSRFRHPLHPFSSRYFNAKARKAWAERASQSGDAEWNFELFSYSYPDLNAAKAFASREGVPPAPWSSLFKALPAPERTSSGLFECSAGELASLLRNLPAQFLRERLGLYLETPGDESLPDDELFTPDTLQNYKLNDRILKSLLKAPELSVKDSYRFHRASGELAPGAIGYLRFSESFSRISAFAKGLADKLGKQLEAPRSTIALSKEDFPNSDMMKSLFPSVPEGLEAHVEYKPERLYENGQAFFRPSSIKAKDLITAWLGHLALNASENPPLKTSMLLGLAGENVETELFHPIEKKEAKRLLALLVCLCVEALCRPVPLFPESSLEYARVFIETPEAEFEKSLSAWPSSDLLARADRHWLSSGFNIAESDDIDFAFCFGSNPVERLSSETPLEERIDALGVPDGLSKGTWLEKASPEAKAQFQNSLGLECLFHSSALLVFLPLLRNLASAEKGRASK